VSTLGTARILVADVQVPPSGAWFATVSLDSSTLPVLGATVLTIGDLQLPGSIIRADWDDAPNGGRPIATVRGGAGWRLPILDKAGKPIAGSYASASGVKLSTVLADLARLTGETVAPLAADLSLGVSFSWPAHAPLAPFHGEDVLADLVARGFLSTWRIAPFTGRTEWTAWPALGAADGRGRITDRARDRGRRTVGLDVAVAAFLPGATLEGVTIARTLIHASASELHAEVYET
jgi:hypothetical protein